MSFDALVVLGCRVGGELSPAALRRVERTALAYRDHGARFVIVCGGKLWHGIMEADAFTQGLAERGVPEPLLLQERESLTTRGNARGARRILHELSLDSIGLVTCDWHMPRALYLFHLLGLSPTPLPAASPARPLHVRGARFLRERASLALDIATSPLWFRV